MGKFDGKVALITGSSRGIGLSIASAFAEENASVVINASTATEEMEEVVSKLRSQGHEVLGIQANISIWNEAERLVQATLARFRKVDILVNNAGIARPAMCYKMVEAEWDAVVTVNLRGTFNCIRLVAPYMIGQKSGKIVNISSIAGRDGMIGNANYSSSKAGIDGLTKTASKELARYGINVNAVAPGFFDTQMTEWLKAPKFLDKYLARIPLARFGRPEEVAALVMFLASKESDYITGQIIAIDGGMIMV